LQPCYPKKYASLTEEANEIFEVYSKTEIRKERETEYHVEKKEPDTSGNLQKGMLEIQGWRDCRNLNTLVCQVSKHTKPSRLMSHVTLSFSGVRSLILRTLLCFLLLVES
jgi:hypothetical protein